MSKLDELIQKYCPDGVEFKTVGEVYRRIKGTPITAGQMKAIADNSGDVRIFAGGKTIVDAFEKDIPNANITREPAVIVQSRGVIDFVYYDKPFTFKNEMWAYVLKDNSMSLKFLYYLLCNDVEYYREQAKGMGSLPQISLPVTEKYKIPVPPLPVQEEIVRILDSFTNYTAELEAELEARKNQYKFYLNYYFERQMDNIVPLASLGSLTRGKRFVHADAVDEGVPCIHYGELYTYYGIHTDNAKSHIREELRSNMRYARKGDVVIVGAGENNIDIGIGVAWEGDEDVAIHDACYTLKHTQNARYISYYLRSDMYHNQIKKYVSSGKICAISAEGLGKAMIPIPSIEEQDRIVSILDRFYELSSDISFGIPSEIEVRKKQYEYYRDKLLSFEGINE